MFNTHVDGPHVQVPGPPYPLCGCGGTLLPVVIPEQWNYFVGSCASYREGNHESLGWKCSQCGREITYGKDAAAREE